MLQGNSETCPLLAEGQYCAQGWSHWAAFSVRWRNRAKCLFQWPPNIVLLAVFMVKHSQKNSIQKRRPIKATFFTIRGKQKMVEKHSWLLMPSYYKMLFGIWKMQSRKQLQLAASISRQPVLILFSVFTRLPAQGQRWPDGQENVRPGLQRSAGHDACLQMSLLLSILNVDFVKLHRCKSAWGFLFPSIGIWTIFRGCYIYTRGPLNFCHYWHLTRLLYGLFVFCLF